MKRKAKIEFILGISLFAVFILYTLSLRIVDVQPIGPRESQVAYATLNRAVHEAFGVNMTLYNITDWAGAAALLVAFGFAVLGLCQLIKRKSILKVDKNILILGAFYIFVIGAYVFFELCVINRRPVLIDGRLEASYPSSTTVLCACIMPSAIMQFHTRIRNIALRRTVNILCGAFTVFMVIGRLVCGVHWFTDILGGLIFSASALLLYSSAVAFAELKSE